VIDDKIGEQGDLINNLIDQIEAMNIPCVKYRQLPELSAIEHFRNISFLLLDWRLLQSEELSDTVLEGVMLPPTISSNIINANINFIKEIVRNCFIPIFIFSNEEKSAIINVLTENELYDETRPNIILIHNKNELKRKNKLVSAITNWIKNNPPIYVLTEWENENNRAKHQLFTDFYKMSPSWPKVFWDNFEKDGSDPSIEFGNLISRNIHTRMSPILFDRKTIRRNSKSVKNKEIRNIMKGEMFIKKDNLSDNFISTGDIFEEEYVESGQTRKKYYLNIRPQCDLMRGSSSDNIELYCLRGRYLDENTLNKKNGIRIIEGQFVEKINHAIVPYITDEKIIEFLFKDLKIYKWSELKKKRIGRLLPPYITRIQQRYSLYLQREGLSRIPKEALCTQ